MQYLYFFDVFIMFSVKVRVVSGVYWFYYFGVDVEEMFLLLSVIFVIFLLYERFFRGWMCFGFVISNDGRNWVCVEGDYYSGVFFDVGVEGEWDFLFIVVL